jgi:putative membrane protein
MNKLTIASAIAGFLSIVPAVSAHGPAEGYQMGPWMMWWGHGVGWIFPVIMGVLMLLICFRILGRRGGGSSWCGYGEMDDTDTPLDILKKRYAKGEINKEEFEAMKKDLE